MEVSPVTQAEAAARIRPGFLARNYRWKICSLLFCVTALSYMDRQVVGILKPLLEKDLGWTEQDYVHIVMSFQIAYGIGYLVMGRLIDRTGVRWGLALAVGVWSLFTMGHGLATTVAGFCIMRAGLGLAEGGNFPGAIKAVTEWFPQKERALAKGFFNSGGSLGAKLTPLFVPWVALTFGASAAFFLTGGLGLLFLIVWFAAYQSPSRHTKVTPEELKYIQTNETSPKPEKISWAGLLKYRTTWAFTLGMFFTSPIWWFYLFWIPDFLHKAHGVPLTHLGGPLIIIYLMSDFGGMAGGALSMMFLRRGWSVRAARMTALVVSVLCVMPLMLIPRLESVWIIAMVIGLAGAAHQGWSSNISAMIGDTMPYQTISSIVGFGGLAGSVGSLFVAQATGWLLETTGSYSTIFLCAPMSYVVAFTAIFFLNPFRRRGANPQPQS